MILYFFIIYADLLKKKKSFIRYFIVPASVEEEMCIFSLILSLSHYVAPLERRKTFTAGNIKKGNVLSGYVAPLGKRKSL